VRGRDVARGDRFLDRLEPIGMFVKERILAARRVFVVEA